MFRDWVEEELGDECSYAKSKLVLIQLQEEGEVRKDEPVKAAGPYNPTVLNSFENQLIAFPSPYSLLIMNATMLAPTRAPPAPQLTPTMPLERSFHAFPLPLSAGAGSFHVALARNTLAPNSTTYITFAVE